MTVEHRDQANPFKWKQYNGEIILWLVSWYGRYALSYRDLMEMAAERGLKLVRSTIMRWVHEYGPKIKKRLAPYFKRTHGSWRVDETYIWIKGRQHYLYRAIDKYSQTLDWYVSPRRDKKAAKTFFKKTLANPYVTTPHTINVDKDRAYPPAHRELIQSKHLDPNCHLRQVKYLNNSIEGDHNSVKGKCYHARWFQSIQTARPTIDAFEAMRMVQKGQLRYAPKRNVCAQNNILFQVFNLAA